MPRFPGTFDEVELLTEDAFKGPDLEEELNLGIACNRLLKSPEYQLATDAVREAIMETFAASPLRDVEGQNYCRLMLKAMEDINTMLQNTVNTGKMAMQQLEERESEDALKEHP